MHPRTSIVLAAFLGWVLASWSPGDAAPGQDADAAPQVPWQRSLEDARAVSLQTGKRMLICVNADGEPASERLARSRYREQGLVDLMSAFVCVMCSPNRHTPKDFDEDGVRIPCPRFGSITCGEHMAAEPLAFESWFEGQRVAPRHVALDEQGNKLFDLFLLNDLRQIDRALEQHRVEARPAPIDLFERRDADARAELEHRYRVGGPERRLELIRKAGRARAGHIDLLRMGLRESAPSLRLAAVEALAQVSEAGDPSLLLETLRHTRSVDMRKALLGRARELAPQNEDCARTAALVEVAVAHGARPGDALDRASWSRAPRVATRDELEARLRAALVALADSPDQGTLQIRVAEANLDLAERAILDEQDPTFFLMDATSHAEGVEQASPRSLAILARARYLRSDLGGAGTAARSSIEASGSSSLADAAALRTLATVSTGELYATANSAETRNRWPASALGEALGSWVELLRRPGATADDAQSCLDLLGWLDLLGARADVLDLALARWSGDPRVHGSFRDQITRTEGVGAIPRAYADRRGLANSEAAWDWYAGYGSLVLAEQRVREGDFEAADSAYMEAAELLDRSTRREPGFGDSAAHYISLAQAGAAHLSLEAGDLELAARRITAAILTRPGTAQSSDGLGRQPAGVLGRVVRALRDVEDSETLARIEGRLSVDAPGVWASIDG